jgi:hypothetical protein
MTNVLILGANDQLARNTIPFFLKHPDGSSDVVSAPGQRAD